MALWGLLGLLGFMGCSSEDAEETMTERSVPVRLMDSVTAYEEIKEPERGAETNGVTRAWMPPSGFSQPDDEDKVIGIRFTQDGAAPKEGFFFRSGGQWRTTVDITPGTFYLYGYVPHISGVTCEISSSASAGDNSSYSTGAVMKLINLPAVTPNDVCVVVGAKNGFADYKADQNYSVTGLARGDFEYVATGSSESSSDYVFLLFDHVYASMRVSMKVNGTYNSMRTIKLKRLMLKTSAGGVPTSKKMNVTIDLEKQTGGDDPINSVVFAPSGEPADEGIVFRSAEGKTLTTEVSDYMGYFMPMNITTLILTSVYDVYDKKGNLVRQNSEATNTIVLNEQFTGQTTARRGCRYSINLTVQPTYLYVLSEPDLDFPTTVVN